MRPIDLIVIHCSATPNGRWTTVEDIDRWHAERGFHRNPALIGNNQPSLKAIAYHFAIYTNGAVATGRGLTEVGAHVKGHNANSIGVCMVGTDKFSPAQWASLKANIEGLQQQFAGARVVGHRDLSPDLNGDGEIEPVEWLKVCPGFSVADWIAGERASLAGHVLEAGA